MPALQSLPRVAPVLSRNSRTYCAVAVSAQSQVPAGQCYVPATASAAGSVGAQGCGDRGSPYCCSDSTCVPDTSGSAYGGGCTSGKAGCCPVSSPAAPTPTTPASPSPTPVSAGQCDVIATASAAGSFGAAGCKGRGSPYCCSSAAADGTCVPDNSGNQYGGGCTTGKAACCPVSNSPSPPATLAPTSPATSSPTGNELPACGPCMAQMVQLLQLLGLRQICSAAIYHIRIGSNLGFVNDPTRIGCPWLY